MTETIPPGSRLGPYEIQGLLGAGGMGEVYRAKDARLGRDVAVKILPSSFAADAERQRRFEREARSAAQLNHPNIVAIHDVGVAGAVPYLVSELIEGTTLRARVAQSPLPPKKALAFAIQIANGLAAAHARGIVHRDLKPENLMVLKGDHLKIVDFGLAKLMSTEAGAAAAREDDTASIAPQLTETGAILGTASYMAPEQIRQQTVDHRADLFAVGAILYEMLTGRRAFDGPTPMDRLSAILNTTPAPLPHEVDDEAPGLSSLVSRCLEKDAEDRFQNALDLSFALGLIDAAAARAHRPSGSTPMSSAPEIEYKRMTYREGLVHTARFAPDGQAICFGSAWEGAPTELFWAYPGNPEPRPLGHPGTDIFSISRTGEMAVSLRRRARGGFVYSGMLARMPAGGGAAREILDQVYEADWSPDGRQLAILREEGGFHRIEHPLGNVIFRTPSWISHMRFSPDGKQIAFLDHPLRGNDQGGPAVVDLNGNVKSLSSGWASARGLAWSPSGEIVFTAYRTGVGRALHATTVDGKERLVLKVPGHMTLADISREGAVLVSLENERLHSEFLAAGASKPRDLSWLDWTLLRAISKDGQWALLEESGVGAGELHAAYLRATDGSPAVRLGDGSAWDLSPDGQWVLGGIGQSPTVLTLLPCGAGETRTVPVPGVDVTSARWFPDGKHACVVGHERDKGQRLYHLEIATGSVHPFGDEGLTWHEVMISPDGTRVAAFGPDQTMKIYPVDGSPAEEMPGITMKDRPVGWSADGTALLLFGRGEVPATVYRVELDGKRTLLAELSPLDPTGIEGMTAVKMTADGQFGYSYLQRLSALYVIEGLFPRG